MRAQVTTVEASPARLDDAIRFFREQVLPRLRQMDGFEEFIVLSARRSGKLLGVALWESEEALRATAEDDSGGSGAANAARSRAADAAGGTVASVEHYEVFVNEAPSAGPLGAVTGTVGGVTDTVGGATDTLLGAERRKAREGLATSTDARRGEGRDR
jgi:heme-degrading monooxygenase HmoA